MKNLIYILFSSILFAGPSTFNIKGMTCAVGCVKKLETQLGLIEGVSSYNIDFEKSLMVLDYDQSKLSSQNIVESLSNSTDFQFSLLDAKEVKEDSPACKKGCCGKPQKVGFFKRIFGWL